jgi:hypothetical protein
MSNLHKDLLNAELHNPKDFSTASNNTKLTKDGSGNLVWAADSGGGGLVTSLTTTGTSGASTLSGAGVLNIPIYAGDTTKLLTQNFEAYGSIATGTEWGISNAQYNSEHKFTVNLGSPTISTITAKNMVTCSVWANPTDTVLKGWNGWVFGSGGTIRLSLYRVKLDCPVEEYPGVLPVCQSSFQTITLTGNTTPICWAQSDFAGCEGFDTYLTTNEMIIITAFVTDGEECSFNMNSNILFQTI